MKVDIAIINGASACYPAVLDGATVNFIVNGAGALEFSCVDDDLLSVSEGDTVQVQIDGANFFKGTVVSIGRGRESVMKIKAVDQIFYLANNPGSYNYEGKTAGQMLRTIAADQQLLVGTVNDGGYVIKARNEQERSLLDIILTATDEVAQNANRLLVFYDDFGKLCLRDLEEMRLDLLIDGDTAADFEYTSSIESGVYNRIRVVHEDTDAGKRSLYVAEDSSNIARWGVLEHTVKADTAAIAKQMAKTMLSLYNRPKRTFSIKGALGDTRVRGGSMVGVFIQAGKQTIRQFFIVADVTHKLSEEQHLMDLTLYGGIYSV